jgi:hypothetical protein
MNTVSDRAGVGSRCRRRGGLVMRDGDGACIIPATAHPAKVDRACIIVTASLRHNPIAHDYPAYQCV